MGTSTMGSETTENKQEKLAKLQTRKKDLEILLAAKNEELYKLCVQEVNLTGVMPPEAPLTPEASGQRRERLGSVKSAETVNSEGDDVRDSSESVSINGRVRNSNELKKHRLSTPSISGMSTKSVQVKYNRRPDTSCSNYYPSPPHEQVETFSMHSSQTYPSLIQNRAESASHIHRIKSPQSINPTRYQTLNTEHVNKGYYNNLVPDISKLRESHFSVSHPDIPTHHQSQVRNTPLIFQYAAQLRAQSPHLSAINTQQRRARHDGRRATLQRTQTYHLTAHSDYPSNSASVHNPPDELKYLQSRSQAPPYLHLDVKDEKVPLYQNLSPISPTSTFDLTQRNETPELKPKEKHWYETSLDTPISRCTRQEVSSPVLRPRNEVSSPVKTNLKRTSSIGNSQTYELMSPPIPPHATTSLRAPTITISTHMSSRTEHPMARSEIQSHSEVTLQSPNNCTVIEQGKWIPYREETKPFEMSDFYKYSTKFRQSQKTGSPSSAHQVGPPINNNDTQQFVQQEHWHHH